MNVSRQNERFTRLAHWRQIGNAIHLYASDNDNRFPPAASEDRNGRLLLSWRVLILPYLEKEELFKRFHLDEPWDSEHNIKQLPEMPDVYKSPYVFRVPKYHTFYQAIVGPGTAFEISEKGLRLFDDFPDGWTDTILIAEATRAVPWTKPEDIPYDPKKPLPEFGARSNSGARSIFLGKHVSMEHVYEFVTCDGGRMQLWRENLSEKTLRIAIERNDGNPVEW